ncbi:MAG: hypothetical protein ABI851_06645 [Saprospiraceae bacterium]
MNESNKKIDELNLKLLSCHKLDSSRSNESKKQELLKTQLDKTEKVLAQIYLQYANNTPRQINETGQYNLNGEIAEENILLKKQIQNQTLALDSLKTQLTKNNVIENQNPILEVKPKVTKKTKTESTPDNQNNLILQLQNNLQVEREKNKQLEKSLSAYSLKLEIMDNERLNEVKGLKNSIAANKQTIDSFQRGLSSRDIEITQLYKEKKEYVNLELTTKEIKTKDILKNKDLELEASHKELDNEKNNNTKLISENNLLKTKNSNSETKIKELDKSNSELSTELKSKKEEILNLQDKNKIQYLSELEKNKSELAQMHKDNLELDSKLIQKDKAIAELEKGNIELKQEKVNLKLEYKNLENKFNESNKNPSQVKVIADLRSKNTELNETIEKQNDQIFELSKKASKTNSKILNKEYLDSLSKKDNQILELSQKLVTIKNSSSQETKKLRDSILVIESKNKKLASKIEELNSKNSNLNTQILAANNSSEIKNKSIKENKISETNNSNPSKSLEVQTTNEKDKVAVNSKANKSQAKKTEPTISKTNKEVGFDEIKPETVSKIQKVLSEFEWPGMSIRNEKNQAIIVIPQNQVFNNETLALSNDGSQLLIKLFSQLNKIKSLQLDIIAYSNSNDKTEEFNLNRAKTISKLFKTLGISSESLNTGSRLYLKNIDVQNFSEGIEMIIRTL